MVLIMLIGYMRISTDEQKLNLQEDDLKRAGCTKIFQDIASGAKTDRNGLEECLEYIREGDTLVVWKLDRLGRSLKHLIDVVTDLTSRNIGFKSLKECIDTNTSGGKLVFHIFGALAEFERDLIRERTRAGLEAARARGREGGRPPKMTPKKIQMAMDLMDKSNYTPAEVCREFKIHRTTLYRNLAKHTEENKASIKAARQKKLNEKLNDKLEKSK